MEIQVITNRCFGLFMNRNVSISRNRTKIERLLDWKEFPSKFVGRFSFQCLTVILCLPLIQSRKTGKRSVIVIWDLNCKFVYSMHFNGFMAISHNKIELH